MATYEIKVTHLNGPRRAAVETFTRLPVKIGRSDECQLRFDPDADLAVSALHAEIVLEGEALRVKDLGSKNGLVLDGHKVEGEAALPGRSVLEIGANGPRVQIAWEAAAGINFNQVRKETAKGALKPEGRPLAATDDSYAAVQVMQALEEEERAAKVRRQALLLGGALVLIGVVGLVSWLLTRA